MFSVSKSFLCSVLDDDGITVCDIKMSVQSSMTTDTAEQYAFDDLEIALMRQAYFLEFQMDQACWASSESPSLEWLQASTINKLAVLPDPATQPIMLAALLIKLNSISENRIQVDTATLTTSYTDFEVCMSYEDAVDMTETYTPSHWIFDSSPKFSTHTGDTQVGGYIESWKDTSLDFDQSTKVKAGWTPTIIKGGVSTDNES